MRYQLKTFFDDFQGYDVHTKWIVGLLGAVFLVALAAVLIVIDLHPTGVGAVLLCVTTIVTLLFARNHNTPPSPSQQAQAAYFAKW